MARHNDKSRQSKQSSSSSSTTETEVFIKKVHHKKKHSPKSSATEIECYSNNTKDSEKSEKCKPRNKKHSSESERPKPKNKKCSSESDRSDRSEKCKPKKKYSSESESEEKDKCSFDEIYKYYKYRLLEDEQLMVAGSNAYVGARNTVIDTYAQQSALFFDVTAIKYNVDIVDNNKYVFYVRESGTYQLFFSINTDQAGQFSVFVNGVSQNLTRSGNNAGAGQLLITVLLKLQKNDNVVIRNDESSTSTITAKLFIGGSVSGNNATFCLYKIGPAEYPVLDNKWDDNCLSRRKKYLFKKIVEKMILDKELMIKGFNIHGSFYNKTSQDVPVESDVVWENYQNVNGLSWDVSKPTEIVVSEDGVYKIFALLHVNKAAQFTFVVNGVLREETTQGVNKGSAILSLRGMFPLKANDVITLKNHTSASSITLTTNAGGSEASVSAMCEVMKISQLCKPINESCKLNNYHKKSFEKFRAYVLHQKCLSVVGSSANALYLTDTAQYSNLEEALTLQTNALQNNIAHIQGTPSCKILQDGIYELGAELLFDQPAQLTIYVNNVPEASTISGRDGGAGKLLVRQLLKLMKNDVLTIVNHTSTAINISTSANSGGNLVGSNIIFSLIRLSAIDDCDKNYCYGDNKKEKKEKKEKK